MLSKYWNNTVITSAADSYCLTCESYLRTTDDVEAHIEKPVHTKKLETTPYYDKYKHDLIREVSSGYFCEACNLLYDTDLEVDLHVVETSHTDNLSKRLLKRSGNTVLAYDEISIAEKAWTGFIGTTCVICKTKVNDENIHKNEKKHILNFIQSKFEFCQGKGIYRQVSNNLQCLTCNELVQISAKSTHTDSVEHKKLYENCRDSNNRNNVDANKAQSNNIDANKAQPNKIDANKAQPNKVDANHSQPNVQEQEKKKSKKNYKPATNSIPKKAKDNAKKGNDKTDADDIEDYVINVLGAKNYITEKDNKKWCLLCDWSLDDCNQSQHVQSRHHLTLLKLHKERIAKKNAGGSDIDEPVSDDDYETDDDDNGDDKILDAVADFTKDSININFETRSATCRKCSDNIDFNYDTIKNHIKEHNKKGNKKDTHVSKFDLKEKDEVKSKTLFTKQVTMKKNKSESVALTEEITNFAKKHEMILKNNRYYCTICSVSLQANIKDLKDHIGTTGHKNRVSRKCKTPAQITRSYAVRVPIKDFIKNAHILENLFFKDIVINDKYCINLMSFYLFTMNNNMCICQLCGSAASMQEADLHKDVQHAEKMKDILVVTSVTDEFLRQIRTGVYHCGYCNLLLEPDDLDDHFDSTSHKENKTAAQARLERYLPEIMMERRQNRFAEVMFFQMLDSFQRFHHI